MKFFVFLLFLVNAFTSCEVIAANYVNVQPQLYIDIFEDKASIEREKGIVEAFERGYNQYENEKLSLDSRIFPFDIVSIEGDEVHFYVEHRHHKSEITPFIARMEKCNGVNDQCLVFDDVLQIFIPKNLLGDSLMTWEKGKYQYKVNRVIRYPFMGETVTSYEIASYCKTCEVKMSWFQYSEDVGIINFQYMFEGGGGFYMLSDEKGFLAPE